MKALEVEWYIIVKANELTIFERFFFVSLHIAYLCDMSMASSRSRGGSEGSMQPPFKDGLYQRKFYLAQPDS